MNNSAIDQEEEEHPGAWKIALADLMTAMMAFFLLMWLLASADQETLKGISEYFTEDKRGEKLDAGSSGISAGRSILDADKLPDSANAVAIRQDDPRQRFVVEPVVVQPAERNRQSVISNDEGGVEQLRSMVKALGLTEELFGQLVFRRDEEGLIIEIVDMGEKPMFAMGTSVPTDEVKTLLKSIAMMIRALPNTIVLRGHTDAYQFKGQGLEKSNWFLSVMRAEQTRVLLENYGAGTGRVLRIQGHADLIPSHPENVFDPRNRRIEIVLRDVITAKEKSVPPLPSHLWGR